ncbi:hypothetical protein Tco_1164218 [Tanacetum coccineum]
MDVPNNEWRKTAEFKAQITKQILMNDLQTLFSPNLELSIRSDDRLKGLGQIESPVSPEEEAIHHGHTSSSPLAAWEDAPLRWNHVRVKLKKEFLLECHQYHLMNVLGNMSAYRRWGGRFRSDLAWEL